MLTGQNKHVSIIMAADMLTYYNKTRVELTPLMQVYLKSYILTKNSILFNCYVFII